MLRFSYPAALWALATLALPLLLHLWRPPVRTVRLGSLRFLEGVARRPLQNLRWRERWLLLARLLLLALLALPLALPVWRHHLPSSPRRWVLVSPGAAINGAALERLRTLLTAGYELHRFTAGFPMTDLRSVTMRETPGGNGEASDVWSLIREADATLPARSELAVFTQGRVADLRGLRPAIRRCHVDWVQTSDPNEEEHLWINSLKLIGARGTAQLDVSIGLGSPALSRFYSQKVPAVAGRTQVPGPAGNFALDVTGEANGEKFSARLLTADGQAIGEWVSSYRQPTLNVLILHGADREDEARYIEAAVRAAALASDGDVALVTRGSDQPLFEEQSKPAWIFWLNGQAVPDSIARLVADGGKLVTEASKGDAAFAGSRITSPAGLVFPGLLDGEVAVRRQGAVPASPAVPLWTDGFGEPLLTLAHPGKGEELHFLSRFHPSWNDLPRGGALPAVMLSLFTDSLQQRSLEAGNDRRVAGANQGSPNVDEEPRQMPPEPAPAYQETNLLTLFWVAALLCFCLERFLSYRPAAYSQRSDSLLLAQRSWEEVRS